MRTDSQRVTAGFFAGLVVFLALPLGLAATFLVSRKGTFDPGYTVIFALVTFVACICSASVLVWSAQRKTPHALALVPALLIPVMVMLRVEGDQIETWGTTSDVVGMIAARSADRANFGPVGFIFTSALLLSVSAATLISIRHSTRQTRLLTLFGGLSLALMSAAFSNCWRLSRDGFIAIADGKQGSDRIGVMGEFVDAATSGHRTGLILLLVIILVAVPIAALASPRSRAEAMVTLLAIVTTGVGVAGAHVRARHAAFIFRGYVEAYLSEDKQLLDGSFVANSRLDIKSDTLLSLYLTKHMTSVELRSRLTEAETTGARVSLNGSRRRTPLSNQALKLCPQCGIFDQATTAIPLVIRAPTDGCEACASIDPNWVRRDVLPRLSWEGPRARFEWTTGDTDQLLNAAELAWHNGHVLSVVVHSAEGDAR